MAKEAVKMGDVVLFTSEVVEFDSEGVEVEGSRKPFVAPALVLKVAEDGKLVVEVHSQEKGVFVKQGVEFGEGVGKAKLK